MCVSESDGHRMEFLQELKERQIGIEKEIFEFLPIEQGRQKILLEAMNYSIKAGGKRLRPLLMSEVFMLLSEIRQDNVNRTLLTPFLAAIEMIHTYSLVHDDLPAMDNDEYRRGKKTTHTVYGEAVGILAGDGLLNLAYETAMKAFDITEECFYPRVIQSLQVLSRCSGIYGMVGGQTVDVINNGILSDKEELLWMYQLKTGALLESAVCCGVILAGGTKTEQNLFLEFAKHLGMAFQIRDDILDVCGDIKLLGKPIHSDEKNQKTTFVSLCGLEAAKEEVIKQSELAVQIYDKNFGKFRDPKTDFFRQLVLELITREK